MAWKDFVNRFNFWKAGEEEKLPPSITDPLSYEDANILDVHFRDVVDEMMQQNEGLAAGIGGLSYSTWISIAEHGKEDRCSLYREMLNNPYVQECVDEIVFTAFNEDLKDNIVNLNIKNSQFTANENISDNLQSLFRYIRDDALNYKYNFIEWFTQFVQMGEGALEYLIPETDNEIVKRGIIGVNFIQSENYIPKHSPNGDIEAFIIKNNWTTTTRILAARDQFAYVDSGMYDFVSGAAPSWTNQMVQNKDSIIRLVKSYIDIAKKPYRQLDALEDAVVIYRLSRAPERLVFNVAAGNVPKNRAEQYVKQLMDRYRKKLTYNTEDAKVDSTQNVKNLLEDYWFIKDNQGKGTDVQSVGQAQALGEITDVEFFVQKLYKALKVPYARFTGESTFEQGSGMPRDEVKFERYVYTILRRFSELIKQVYIQHLKLVGVWDLYDMHESDIEIVPTPPSSFTYMKNAEKLEAQFSMFANYANNIDTEEPLFARETALKKGLGWTDEEIKSNEVALRREKGMTEEGGEEEGGEEEGMDFGGDMGLGGDMGGDMGLGGDMGGEDLGGDEGDDIDIDL